jgi:hypothetical protein
MRWYHKTVVVAALMLVAVAVQLGTAEQPGQSPLGFGKTSSNPATLIQLDSVKKELKLTDEQVAKIPDAVMKALAEVLEPDQIKRLKQIELQAKGARAFTEPAVQASLKINGEQKDNIQAILDESEKDLTDLGKELQKAFTSGSLQAIQSLRDKMTAINKEMKERCHSVLTADQKREWQEMIGDEFRLESPKLDKKK